MRLTFSESDLDPKTQLPPAVNRAASDHIAEQQIAAGWVDPDKTRLVPVAELATRRTTGTALSAAEPDEADQDEEKEQKTFLGLSLPQVIGGVLASTTAAIVGGQLGVAGTVLGAAMTTIIITVGGAMYTHGITRTKSSLGVVASRFRLGGTTPLKNVPDLAADSPEANPAVEADPALVAPATSTSWRDRISPKKLLATAAAIFLLAAVAVTGLEALRGQSFSGGGQTTVSQLGRDGLSSGTTSKGDATSDRKTDPSRSERDATRPTPTTSAEPTTRAEQNPAPASAATPTTRATSSTTPTVGSGSGAGGASTSGGATTGAQPSSGATTAGGANGTSAGSAGSGSGSSATDTTTGQSGQAAG